MGNSFFFFNNGIHRFVGGLCNAASTENRLRNVLVTMGGAGTGKSPVGNACTGGIDPQIAAFLQSVAWETVEEYYAPARKAAVAR